MGSYIPPSSFHTFDPIRNSPDSIVNGIISSMSGNHGELLLSAAGIEEVAGLKEGEDSPLTGQHCYSSLFSTGKMTGASLDPSMGGTQERG